MALINCPDCGHSCSTAAPLCPQCGRQMRAQTGEQTSKRYKRMTMLGHLIFWPSGMAWMIGAIQQEAGAYALAGAVALILLAKAGAWWDNG